ncbi:hypothetical protein HDV63DRAFT_151406 [Trichoderma sp. SZMC 28014]
MLRRRHALILQLNLAMCLNMHFNGFSRSLQSLEQVSDNQLNPHLSRHLPSSASDPQLRRNGWLSFLSFSPVQPHPPPRRRSTLACSYSRSRSTLCLSMSLSFKSLFHLHSDLAPCSCFDCYCRLLSISRLLSPSCSPALGQARNGNP